MSSIASFETTALFGQVTLYRSGPLSFPLWTDAHLPQAFSTNGAAVSFALPDHEGSFWVEIEMAEPDAALPPAMIRAIQVPLVLPSFGATFESADGTVELPIPPGPYGVRFVVMPGRAVNGFWMTYILLLQIVPGEFPASILKADEEMTGDAPLVLNAETVAAS